MPPPNRSAPKMTPEQEAKYLTRIYQEKKAEYDALQAEDAERLRLEADADRLRLEVEAARLEAERNDRLKTNAAEHIELQKHAPSWHPHNKKKSMFNFTVRNPFRSNRTEHEKEWNNSNKTHSRAGWFRGNQEVEDLENDFFNIEKTRGIKHTSPPAPKPADVLPLNPDPPIKTMPWWRRPFTKKSKGGHRTRRNRRRKSRRR